MRYAHIIKENNESLWYHGSGHDIKKFSLEFTTWENTNQYGPGVYFTNDINTAYQYASGESGKVYVCEIHPRKTVSVKTKINSSIIKKLIITSPDEEKWNDWAETKSEGLRLGINAVLQYNSNMYDAILAVWSDWYRGYEKTLLTKLTEFGIDGAMVPQQTGETYFIAYNVEALSLVKVLARNQSQ